MKHLFDDIHGLRQKICNRHIMLFLDYDGTLAPIAFTPNKATITDINRALLRRLSKCRTIKLAIISGRSLKDIKGMVRIKGITYSGNHGLEIEGPRIKFTAPMPAGYMTALRRIKNRLSAELSSIKGVLIEDKGHVLSLHYRLINRKKIPLVRTVFHETVIFYLAKGRISVKPGKKVVEVRPPVRWDKGKAVLWILARQRLGLKRKPLTAIYIGDDITDEDAFKALRGRGLGVFVGSPRPSFAGYYLRGPGEVTRFLKLILKAQRGVACRN